ncbi:MAG: pyridoxal 5'-phosphate synthase glutaminase subunit PdxT [Dehalococcoidia bacterium]|nr:MAG: pyridoxal 5'-phosphate synthase glutaminase subunit PdxT [Dehalococcoidia bacterium]
MKIGVLALQGAFREHIAVLKGLGTEAIEVRLPEQLADLSGLVIPGGESTTISKLMQHYRLVEPLRELARKGTPILGTCAGLIVLAKHLVTNNFETLGLMDITVARNAFGRQVESFEAEIEVPALGKAPFRAVFIRAPIIEKVAPGVEVLAKLENDTIVAARQGKVVVTAFHPELAGDTRFHRYFLDIVGGAKAKMR